MDLIKGNAYPAEQATEMVQGLICNIDERFSLFLLNSILISFIDHFIILSTMLSIKIEINRYQTATTP